MAKNLVYKFKLITDVADFLNGAVVGGQVAITGGTGSATGVGVGISGLVGTTLIFVQPAVGTVTFAASSGAGGSAASPNTNPDPNTLLFMDIKAQIEAVMTGVTVKLDGEGRMVIVEKTSTNGVTINKTGTSNRLLGFDSAQNSVGKIYAPPPSATPPCWTWAYTGNENSHIIYVLV
jgi:hypothetical protein